MVLIAGFGYARPVPVNPRNYLIRNADFYVASAGPMMNLMLGLLASILHSILLRNNLVLLAGVPVLELLKLFILINFNLCLFNLIPLGPLDGNFVFSHFLPSGLKRRFQDWNYRRGSQTLIGLVILSMLLPEFSAFSWISSISMSMINGLL